MSKPAILAAALLALQACSTGGGGSLDTTSLSRAGGPAGSGGVCAYYSGNRSSGRIGINESFQRRACFPSMSACRSWFYQVQTQFPVTRLRKPCGS